MMYRHNTGNGNRRNRHGGFMHIVPILVLVVLAVFIYAFVRTRNAKAVGSDGNMSFLSAENNGNAIESGNVVFRKRMLRDNIPIPDFRSSSYGEIFNDSNYVQLATARAIGLEPSSIGDPEHCKDLVQIFNTDLYKVDTMYHAKPYLIPEAALLLYYIAERFQELMKEHYPDCGKYKIIVTSALRTESSERNLRRVNRNATDTSCHMYGTTFDISAQRYEFSNGRDTVVDFCKQMLATALFELRHEGLCYVKYERRSCFHITLRTTQYEGNAASKTFQYNAPGSPAYLRTKSLPRPKARPVRKETPQPVVNKPKPKPQVSKPVNKKEKPIPAKQPVKKEKKTTTKPVEPRPQPVKLTERERLSLENFERRY